MKIMAIFKALNRNVITWVVGKRCAKKYKQLQTADIKTTNFMENNCGKYEFETTETKWTELKQQQN